MLNTTSQPNPEKPFQTTVNNSFLHEDLSWERLDYKIANNLPLFQKRCQIAINMSPYIVILSETFVKTPYQLILFDPKNKLCHNVPISVNQLPDMDKCIACHWNDNKILVFGWKKTTNDEQSLKYNTYLGVITILKNDERVILAVFSLLPPKVEITTESHKMHVSEDEQLFIVSTIKTETGYEREITLIDLESFSCEKLSEKMSGVGSLFHATYVYENKLYCCQNPVENMNSLETFEVNLETFRYKKRDCTEPINLNKPGVKFQEADGKLFIFGDTEELYKNLLIFDIELKIQTQIEIEGIYPKLSVKNSTMTILDDIIFAFGSSNDNDDQSNPEIWCLSLSRLDETKSKQHKENPLSLSNLLKEYLTEAPQHDVIFEVENESIPAHKWWLIKRSKYFANMFSNEMMEAQSSSTITISDMKASTFKALLEFIYTDYIDLDESLSLSLLQQADKFLVPDLKQVCEKYLLKRISAKNYVQIANIADLSNADLLKDATVNFIARNLKVLKEQPDFRELSNNILKDVIIKVGLQSD